MNNIQEKDWAEDCWHGHTGLDSSCDYCIVHEEIEKASKDNPEAGAKEKGITNKKSMHSFID